MPGLIFKTKTSHFGRLFGFSLGGRQAPQTPMRIINTIQITKQVTLEKLATSLPLPIKQNSRRRHLPRFLTNKCLSVSLLTNKCLSVSLLWFPLIQSIIKSLIPPTQDLIIALDRTQWDEYNILMVSVVYQRRSFPIY
jgi:hypothetical protein